MILGQFRALVASEVFFRNLSLKMRACLVTPIPLPLPGHKGSSVLLEAIVLQSNFKYHTAHRYDRCNRHGMSQNSFCFGIDKNLVYFNWLFLQVQKFSSTCNPSWLEEGSFPTPLSRDPISLPYSFTENWHLGWRS